MTLQMGKIVKNGVEDFDISDCDVTYLFPALWGRDDDGFNNPGVEDAGTIYFHVDQSHCGDGREFITSITLQELVEDVVSGIADHIHKPPRITEPEISDAKRIVAALRSAADWLESHYS